MSLEQDTIEIERERSEYQKDVDMMEALRRLNHNPDFKLVVSQGYFEQEAARIAIAKSEPALQRPEVQDRMARDIDAIGSLFQYFRTIGEMGEQAKGAIQDADDELSAIEQESREG